ncbi:hypothetical protein M430DRAFT_18796 [Amorphotheca resinae ATCC 22711]|uniref:Uncharacterized protein n=1 Tax=Amorphotheca resinae ATCC 22711 TaxID=857342 RepID=A0A2T3B4T4_AMORE|nr:hypothetical protein M430DRAFT_18796 [Amorphotheca resinae ATCC 22711]PSS20643.1 hypothetical protein M430DRAFT_18796 [Amorphotheca resinae ATCC 22711]
MTLSTWTPSRGRQRAQQHGTCVAVCILLEAARLLILGDCDPGCFCCHVCAMWEGVLWGPEPANGNSGGLSCRVELVRDPVGRHYEGHALCIHRTKESVADYGISLIRCIIVEFE